MSVVRVLREESSGWARLRVHNALSLILTQAGCERGSSCPRPLGADRWPHVMAPRKPAGCFPVAVCWSLGPSVRLGQRVDLEPGLCCRGSQGSKLLQPTVLAPTCHRPVLTFG